jgi:DtxR family Mn-dependent transcriptional regulator
MEYQSSKRNQTAEEGCGLPVEIVPIRKANVETRAAGRAVSQSVEDFIKAVYELQHDGRRRVTTNDIARSLGTSPAATSKMSKALDEHKLLTHEPYRGVCLTPSGEKIALETIRHHRLVELYLVQALGYGWDEVDAEAERLEHHISEEFEERIDQILGYPRVDPHGHPIPDREGSVAPPRGVPLTGFQPGDCVEVVRVSDGDPRLLQILSHNGIGLNARLEVLAVPTAPVDDGATFTVRLNAETAPTARATHDFALDLPDAGHIFVEPCAL